VETVSDLGLAVAATRDEEVGDEKHGIDEEKMKVDGTVSVNAGQFWAGKKSMKGRV
jgi:hypothetical protein